MEIAIGEGPPAAGEPLGAVHWPPGCVPVSVLRNGTYRDASPALTLCPADHVGVLAPMEGDVADQEN